MTTRTEGTWTLQLDVCEGEQHDGSSMFKGERLNSSYSVIVFGSVCRRMLNMGHAFIGHNEDIIPRPAAQCLVERAR